jgi:hypothetical protein
MIIYSFYINYFFSKKKFLFNKLKVAKFVIAVLDFIIPLEFWGDKDNKTVIYKMVRIFIERRRFEVLSLHEVLQGFKVCSYCFVCA